MCDQELALLAQQVGQVLALGVADGAGEERDVDVPVGHRLHVLVFEVHGTRPEHDVGHLDDVEDLLVDVEQRHVAAAAARGPVHPDLQLVAHVRSSLPG
jgi:hypothetical protein